MNTPVVSGAGGAGIENSTKLIRAVGVAELVLGFLLTVAAGVYGQFALKRAFPADVPFWTSLSSPTTLRMLYIVWTVYLVSLFLFWHGMLCRRRQRSLRPIGFAVGTLLAVKFTFNTVALVVVRLGMDSINITVDGNAVNMGSQFGIYADLLICVAAAIAVLAACFAAICASQETRKALEASDPAHYTLDSIPLSVFLGVVLFIYVGYGYLADVIHPSLNLVGIPLSTLAQQGTSLAFAAGCGVAAWAFYNRRPWGWSAGLLVSMAWALSNYSPPDDISTLSGPEFEKYRDFLTQITPAFRDYIQFLDILMFVGLLLFVGYLVYVRRYLVDKAPALRSSKSSGLDVPIYADWRHLKMLNKSWLIFAALGFIQLLQHDYFIALIFIVMTIVIALLMVIGIFTPRYVFREEGLALPGFSRLATPVFPYTSFKSVQLITTVRPPKGMRSIENGVLNLNVAVFADDQRARLEGEFRKRGIAVTVLAPATAAN